MNEVRTTFKRMALYYLLLALNSNPNVEPEQILKNVRAYVDEFVKDAEQFDDLTMLCVEYRGSTN
ncbi:MAG: hypothetical protein IJ731_08450 [Eubacterium sp.]|nr:hypothetical protein [Eubacterium sp.]